MAKSKKLIQKLTKHKDIEVPYDVWRFFGSQTQNGRIQMSENLASFGEDFGTVEELRDAIEFYVDQLGGKVKWE